MFNIGPLELLVIAVVALVFVGPKQLPDLMRQAGKLFVKLRRTATEVRSGFDEVVRQAEDEIRREELQSLQKALAAAAAATSQTAESETKAENPHAPVGARPLAAKSHAPVEAADAQWRDVTPKPQEQEAAPSPEQTKVP